MCHFVPNKSDDCGSSMASVTASLYSSAFLIWLWFSAPLNLFCPNRFGSYILSLLDHMLKEGQCRGCEEFAITSPGSATSLLCGGFLHRESRGGLILWKYLAAAFYCSLLSRNYQRHCITGVHSTSWLVCIFRSRTSSSKQVPTHRACSMAVRREATSQVRWDSFPSVLVL